MLKSGLSSAAILCLAACGGGSGCIGGPGEVALGGLRYDVCPGSSGFVDVDATPVSAMPTTTGDVTYTGVLRAELDGVYRDGTAMVVADFSTPDVVASGNVDFTGVGDAGIINYNETVPITGNTFGNGGTYTPGNNEVLIDGGFYGPNADLAAGQVFVDLMNGSMRGTFITQR